MIANATVRRRANAFAQALDAQAPAPDVIEGEAAGQGSPGDDRDGRGARTPDTRSPGEQPGDARPQGARPPGGAVSDAGSVPGGEPGGGRSRKSRNRDRSSRPDGPRESTIPGGAARGGAGRSSAIQSSAGQGSAIHSSAAHDRSIHEGTAQGGAVPDGVPRTAQAHPAQGRGAHAADRHADAAQDRMLAVTSALGSVAAPALSAEVKTVQRAQLVAVMEAAFANGRLDPEKVRLPEQRDRRTPGARQTDPPLGARPEPVSHRLGRFRPKSRWGRRLAVSGLAVGVAAGGFSGAAVASSDALPGDTLYGLKRSMEDLRLSMADGDTDRGDVYLDLASTRLKEARRLMERSKAGPLDDDQIRDVRRALAGMRDEARQGHSLLSDAYRTNGSLKPIQVLAAFSDTQRVHWSQLSPLLPTQLSQEREGVSSVLDAIEQEVVPLRALLPPASNANGSPSAHGSKGGSQSASEHAKSGGRGSAPASASGTTRVPSGSQSATSPASGQDGGGLLGGTGLLPTPGPTGDSGTPDGKDGSRPDKEVTLQPLLPGLFPGLGLGSNDDGGH